MLSQDLDQLVALVPQYLHHGEFELTAGGSVTWYIDGREPLLNDAGVKIAGRILNHLLLPETEVVAGPATAGIIVVSAVLQAPTASCWAATSATTTRVTACKSRSPAAASMDAK